MMLSDQQERWLQRISELFMRYGIKSVTMDDVARELGVSKKTIYQFVSSKNDLVMQLIEYHISQEIRQQTQWQQESADALEEIRLVIQNVVKEMQLMRTNILYDLQKYHREAWERFQEYQRGHIMDRVRKNLERGIMEGVYRTDFNVEIVARLHVAQSFLLFDEGWFPQNEFSRDDLFREYIRQYLNGILTDEGRRRLKTRCLASGES